MKKTNPKPNQHKMEFIPGVKITPYVTPFDQNPKRYALRALLVAGVAENSDLMSLYDSDDIPEHLLHPLLILRQHAQIAQCGQTPLMRAARYGFVDMVELLLRDGHDINARNMYHETALIVGVMHRQANVVHYLIRAGANVNVADAFGWTPLIYTAAARDLEVLGLLIDAGAKLDEKTIKFGMTALHHASMYGHKQAISMLIKAHASVNVIDNKGDTALMYAVMGDSENATRVLLVAGADANVRNDEGNTPLIVASERGCVAIVRLLLGAKSSTNFVNKRGQTALMKAIDRKHVCVARDIIKAGGEACLVMKEGSGETALIYAARNGHVKIARMIMKIKQHPPGEIATALLVASELGHREMVKELLGHHGASKLPNALDIVVRNMSGLA